MILPYSRAMDQVGLLQSSILSRLPPVALTRLCCPGYWGMVQMSTGQKKSHQRKMHGRALKEMETWMLCASFGLAASEAAALLRAGVFQDLKTL